MVSPTQQQTRIMEWLENHLPNDNSVGLQDVTSMYTVLSIAGPKSKDLMEELSGEDMDMPLFTYREVNVGYASGVMVMAVTNTGEPGYSLYIPSEFALRHSILLRAKIFMATVLSWMFQSEPYMYI